MEQTAPSEFYSDLCTRGFEALFDPVTNPEPVSTSSDTLSDIPSIGTWTLRAASEKLGLSPNTIRKRIRTGQLRANKVVGFNGPEWRIQPPTHSPGIGATDIADTTAAAGTDLATINTLLKLIETQARQLEIATTQLTISTEHVKAATRVIAYQQVQLEEKDSRVKLLTDSCHHDWWLVKFVRKLKESLVRL